MVIYVKNVENIVNDILNDNYFIANIEFNTPKELEDLFYTLYGSHKKNNLDELIKNYNIYNEKIILLKKTNLIKKKFETLNKQKLIMTTIIKDKKKLYFDNPFILKNNENYKRNVKNCVKTILSELQYENNERMKMYR